MLMAVYPTRGLDPWDDELRLYIDDEDDADRAYIDQQVATVNAVLAGKQSKATLDADTADLVADVSSALRARIELLTHDALPRTPWARNIDQLVSGPITRNPNGAATSAPVTWPDGTPGTYTALVLSTAHPGAVDSYQVTYGDPMTQTYTQPTVTRDASGAVVNLPAIEVT